MNNQNVVIDSENSTWTAEYQILNQYWAHKFTKEQILGCSSWPGKKSAGKQG